MLGITRFTSRANRKLKKISQYIAILLQISEPILRGFSSVIRFAYEWNALHDLVCSCFCASLLGLKLKRVLGNARLLLVLRGCLKRPRLRIFFKRQTDDSFLVRPACDHDG